MKKLYRSENDKRLCGVCGGIAEYLELDSTLVRIITIILCCMVGSGLFVYFLIALIMPEKPVEIIVEKDLQV